MSNTIAYVDNQTLTNIADAVRYKTGTNERMLLNDIPDKIRNLDTSDITALDTRVTAVEGALADKADSADVTALDTRVTAVEGALEDKADADDVGDLSQLETTAKNSLVSAINETDGAITETNGRLTQLGENVVRAVTLSDFVGESENYILGNYSLTNGTFLNSSSSCVDADKKSFELMGDAVTLVVADGFRARAVIFDSNGNFVTYMNWQSGTSTPSALQNRKGYFIKTILGKSDGSRITAEEAATYGSDSLKIVTVVKSPIADKYDTNKTYQTGDLCLHDVTLYKCNADNVTGSWNGAQWTETTVAVELSNNPSVKAISDTMYTYAVNVLDPDTLIDNGYYYDFADGATQISNGGSGTKFTADIINTGLIPSLHIRQTFDNASSSRIFVYFYAGETYLGYRMIKFSEIGSGDAEMSTYAGADGIRVYVNNKNVLGSQICISLERLDAFTPYELTYSIKREQLNFKLKGKTVVNFGDSIFGNKRPPNDVSTELANLTGATVYNLGFGGCRMAKASTNWNPFSMYSLAAAIANNDFSAQDAIDIDAVGLPSYFKETRALLESLDFNKVDIVTISYGTNDFASSVALDDENNPYNTNTFAGALRYSLETLWSTYPHLQIFVCTPTYRFWMDENNQFLYDSNTHEIDGQLLTQFVEKAIDVSKSYQIPYIDNYYDLGINRFNRSAWFPATDGTHHNYDGAKLIARHMANVIF